MKTTKTRLISWLLVLTMVISIISPGSTSTTYATEDYDGYVYVTVERFTLGQGFAEEPMRVGYYEEESLAQILVRGFGDKLVTSSGQYGTSIDGYKDGGEPEAWSSEMIPDVIKEKLTEANCTISARTESSVLSNYDYTGQSYFMLCVDNVAPNYGVDGIVYNATETNDTYEKDSVIRLQFGIYSWGSDLNTSYSEPLISFPNKDDLIKAVADYTGAKTDAVYTDAISVLEDWDATEEEVVAAQEKLETTTLSESYDEKCNQVVNYVKDNTTAEFGNEWNVLTIARNNVGDSKWYRDYYTSVEETVKEKDSNKLSETKSTENSRVIIALSAIGANPADVAGYNLLEPYADYEYVTKQGVNGTIYALIALDCDNYAIPEASEGTTQTTRDNLVNAILDGVLENGGWAWSSSATAAEADMTAMAIQALAPYYDNADVKAEVDKAVGVLSDMQAENGHYVSWGAENCNSIAQVVIALTALGIDAETDTRFVKSGVSVLDAMLSFYDATTGAYRYKLTDTKVNAMATRDVAHALTTYSSWKAGKNTLYDMTDVTEPLYVCKHATTEKKDAKEATCTVEGYTGDTYCVDCGEKLTIGTVIAKKEHTVVTDAAVAPTETTAGKTEGSHCSICNTVIVAQTEVPVTGTKTEDTGKTEGTGNTEDASKTENSTTEQKTEPTVEKPSKTSLKKVTSSKKGQIKITWKKKSGITGYQIQVSTSSKFKTKQTKKYTVKKAKTTSKTIKKLKSGKKYYVRIRTYKTQKIDGKNVTKYSKWVKKSVRVK